MRDIQALIARLTSLQHGDAVVGQLIAAGDAAIEPLRRFLLDGRPGSLYEPRRWAVEALGGLGARDVLLEYLHSETAIPDPVIRMSEDVVRDAAIRELMSWPSEGLYLELLELARRRLTPGLVEALGEFGREDALPMLDRALEDDVCRPAAEGAFRRIGAAAVPMLELSAATPVPDRAEETASSLMRRRCALKLLRELDAGACAWPGIEPLLDEPDAEIAIRTAHLGLRVAPESARRRIGLRALELLPALPWDLREAAAECIATALPEIGREIDAAIEQRRRLPAAQQVVDGALTTLLRLRQSSRH
jgi:hypothetical protein